MKPLLVLILIFSFSIHMAAQQSVNAINEPYEAFSKAYASLDVTHLADYYMEDAVLVNLYENDVPNSVKGATAIKDYFQSFFKKIKGSGQTLALTLKITDREKVNNRYFDNGYYKLTRTGPEQAVQIGYGKLSTVLIWDEGKWKFQVDANTNTTEMEYENAQADAIAQPK